MPSSSSSGRCPHCGRGGGAAEWKGERLPIHPDLSAEARGWLRDEAAHFEVSISALVADLLCLVVGRPDLIREVPLSELHGIRTAERTDEVENQRRAKPSSIRVPAECWTAIYDCAKNASDLLERRQPKRRGGQRSRPTNLLAAHILETVMKHGVKPLHDVIVLLTDDPADDHGGGQEVLPMVG